MAPEAVTRERVTAWIRQDLQTLAPAWLRGQRWFGGKSRAIDAVGIEDVIWLPLEAFACALVVIEVEYTPPEHGLVSRDRYAIIVGVADDPMGCPIIAGLSWRPGLHVFEATTSGPVLHALLSGLAASTEPLRGDRGGEIAYADATPRAKHLLTAGTEGLPRVVPVGVEQSNTSVRVNSTHVFKLFRRLENGANPQLEIGRFLRKTAFRAAPPLEGSLVYRGPHGDACALGALEGWVDNQGDGWRYVLAQLEHAPGAPMIPRQLAEDMRTLGATTADFHVALASDASLEAFAPEPITSSDRLAWHRQVLAQAARTFDLVEHHVAQWPEAVAELGRSLLRARHVIARRLAVLESSPLETFPKIRIHGDFHLGQTLRTQAGFAIIDFEGEPTKPLAERRQKQCVLRDVAGMVRSLEYAEATAQARAPDAGEGALSVSSLREAFVDSYRSRLLSSGARLVPSSPGAVDEWIRLFELEKALYEVEYEANNRPDWVRIPLRAVGRLLTRPG